MTTTPADSPLEAMSAASDIKSVQCSESLETPLSAPALHALDDAEDPTSEAEDPPERAPLGCRGVCVRCGALCNCCPWTSGFAGTKYSLPKRRMHNDGVCSESCMTLWCTWQSLWRRHSGRRSVNGTSFSSGEWLARRNLKPVLFPAMRSSNPQCWLATEISKIAALHGLVPLSASALDNPSLLV